MAQMIPANPFDCDDSSHERDLFYALEKLPDDYYVFHSYRVARLTDDNSLVEREIDFVIFNPNKGVLCIEAKAGAVRYENRQWYYSNGELMPRKGPYIQASTAKFELLQKAKKIKHLVNSISKCKFLSAVWFISIDRKYFSSIKLPADVLEEFTLTSDDLVNPKESLDRIFDSYAVGGIQSTNLSKFEEEYFLRDLFCPEFGILPSPIDLKEKAFNRFLQEQMRLLEYLEEQPTAVINGAAGTGKTMIALEKARRESVNGDKVLFLCFNNMLKEYLQNHFAPTMPNVDFYTVDGYVCKKNNSPSAELKEYLQVTESILNSFDQFDYQHIVIDEGQDFAQPKIIQSGLLQALFDVIELKNGTFFIFYDKNQMVQSYDRTMKKFSIIEDADCKLTLYKNCRNTLPITKTSVSLFDKKLKEKLSSRTGLDGTNPKTRFTSKESCMQDLDDVIQELHKKGYAVDDIVIISCSTTEKTLYELDKNNLYKSKYKFTTARKFKGLESNAVILVDITAEILKKDPLVFYVGTSRARMDLQLLVSLTDEECSDIYYLYADKKPLRRVRQSLKKLLMTV